MMRIYYRMRSYKTFFFIFGLILLLSLVFLMVPFDEVGFYCTYDQLPNEKCMCMYTDNASAYLAASTASPRPVRLHEVHNDSYTKCLMTSNPQGRLGNLMGEYATLYALAKTNGRPAFVVTEMALKLRNYFNLSLPVLDNSIAARIPWKEEILNDWMEPSYTKFNSPFVKLAGYPCSWTFYHHMRQEIAREFVFHGHIAQKVNAYLAQVKGNRSSVTFVGVHIRRGDYVQLMKSLYQGVLADSEYLAEAMQRFHSRYSNVVFVVCSDDLDWAKDNIDAAKYEVVFGWSGQSSNPGMDMALLSSCNHSIMTIGTFGYWASYLAGGHTIYLTNFTLPSSKLLKVFKYDAALLPDWEGIQANLTRFVPVPSGTPAVSAAFILLVVSLCLHFVVVESTC